MWEEEFFLSFKIDYSDNSNSNSTTSNSNYQWMMVIAKILSVQEKFLNSSIINLKINDSDSQWSIHSFHQMQPFDRTSFDSKNLPVAELIIGTVTYVVSKLYVCIHIYV